MSEAHVLIVEDESLIALDIEKQLRSLGYGVLETAVTPQENQSWVTCTIRDTGPGINAADLPNLFDRFYRGESSHDFTVPGIGLGLAICHDIVNKLGGHLTVESEPGQGAAFTIWLQLVGAA